MASAFSLIAKQYKCVLIHIPHQSHLHTCGEIGDGLPIHQIAIKIHIVSIIYIITCCQPIVATNIYAECPRAPTVASRPQKDSTCLFHLLPLA